MTTTAVSTRRARGIHPKRAGLQQKPRGKGSTLPEYLEAHEVQALIAAAPHPRAKLLMLTQWRAGLRVSEALANREPDPVAEDPAASNNHTEPPSRRELTPRQLALWKAVQHARVQGLSLREIARQLGISRNSVRKYARALTKPSNRPHNHGIRPPTQMAANRSD